MMNVQTPEPSLGAIVTGINVNQLDDADWRSLYQVFLDRQVLVVRNQNLTLEQFIAYSGRFGRVKPHRVRRTRHPDMPQVTLMGVNTKTEAGQVNKLVYNRGEGWHTDGPWDADVCKATQLYAVAIPSFGGDTLFANMYEAYDRLPDALKRRIEGVNAEFTYGGIHGKGADLLDPADRNIPPAVYPLVRVHPETGRKALYINGFHLLRIVGMSTEEGNALSEELLTYVNDPPSCYRHRWQVGDVVIWDNRCTIHTATGGYPINEKRIHWRVTIMQDAAQAAPRVDQAA